MRPDGDPGDLDAPGGPGASEPPAGAEPWPELLPAGATAAPVAPPQPELLDPHVAEILQEVRSGVRQRAAETETAGAGSAGSPGSDTLRQGLLALRQHEFVAEPVPFSHRAGLGRAIVFARKAVYHLFSKWRVRPLLEQQNGFNQAAGRLLQALVEAAERSERERRELAGRVAELERQAGSGEEKRRA